MSRPFWHYQYVKEEKLLILINDDSLKRRLAHHGLKYYNRKDAIKTLIDIEIKKEKEYAIHKCVCCSKYRSSCICRKTQTYEKKFSTW